MKNLEIRYKLFKKITGIEYWHIDEEDLRLKVKHLVNADDFIVISDGYRSRSSGRKMVQSVIGVKQSISSTRIPIKVIPKLKAL